MTKPKYPKSALKQHRVDDKTFANASKVIKDIQKHKFDGFIKTYKELTTAKKMWERLLGFALLDAAREMKEEILK